MAGDKLIVAGSVHCAQQIHALAAAGADAFTIGSAVFDGTFSPTKGSLRGQILDILEALVPLLARFTVHGPDPLVALGTESRY